MLGFIPSIHPGSPHLGTVGSTLVTSMKVTGFKCYMARRCPLRPDFDRW